MPKRSKILQDICNIFNENDVNFELFEDSVVLKELRERLGIITDKRHDAYIKYKLKDVIMITLLAVLSNANEWLEIEEFAKSKRKWLETFLELPNGTPSDDTFRIIISSLDSNYVYNVALQFLIDKMNDILSITNKDSVSTEKEVISVDGKTSCGSKRNKTDKSAKKALHTMNAYSSSCGFCVGQVFVDEKSNEIPAMKELLNIIDVKDTIVTWDALNTQKDTVEKVVKEGGDYVGALKGNQHNLYQDVKDYFDEDTIKKLKNSNSSYEKMIEKEHSAIVTREYYLSNDINWLHSKEEWKKLKTIGLVRKTVEKNNGEIIHSERFFIASFDDINNFSKAVREHWGIENGLHWQLDFTFKDDKNTTMAKTGAKNLQIFKKLSMAILKLVQTMYNCSLKLIRYKLSLEFEYEIERIFKMLNTNDLRNLLDSKK